MLKADDVGKDLFKACESLFGEDVDVSLEFLRYLKPSGLKAAYRRRAMETHPDRAVLLGGRREVLEQRFKEINLAYQLLQAFLSRPWKYSLDERGSIYRPKKTNVRPYRSPTAAAKPKYCRHIPDRKLLFGQYLYYCGHIELKTLINAVVWQRLQRPAIGKLAVRLNWLSASDIYDILKKRFPGEKFGECALRSGYLSRYQLMLLLQRQKMLQPQIGKYFIEKKILSASGIYKLISAQRVHNRKFRYL